MSIQYCLPALFAACFAPCFLFGQANPALFEKALEWRMIGPHRGGRTVGAVGVPQQPNTFYIGVNNGGVWKTTDAGRTWLPIFDEQPTGSVGDVAVAPSDPNVLYVASGEGLQRPDLSVGNGVYKSTDGGNSWTNTGLREALQIGGLAIDPRDPNRVFAAVLGHPYGPNAERGVYRSANGGKSWERVLFRDENTGAIQVTIDPNNPAVVYADLWESRLAPWENGQWQGEGSGLWKSTDGGNTWRQLTKGLPTPAEGLGRIGFCIAPSDSKCLYATVDAGKNGGIYRSDDAGESWYRTDPDPRLWGRGSDFAEVKCDPKNADVVYSANVVTWKSTDGGKHWFPFRGAPGGDDYHRIWINPDDPNIMLLGSDQGAIITVNGGQTFSSWYNQPTAQFYHVSTDNDFPYNVYGGQQESGSVGIASRGHDGQVTFREWRPVGVEEYGYVAADPLDPNIIYGGKITKHDKRTGQTQNIAPEAVRSGQYRFIRTAPVLFSPVDPHTLFFAGNVLFKTRNGGHSWQVISPDLSRENYPELPACIGKYRNEEMKKMPRRGVIYTVAPSHVDSNVIWAGTDDGLIHVTRNGGASWENVTPPGIPIWAKISLIDAGHSNANVAYVAVNAIRLDDLRAHIWRTRDGGKTWKEITAGLPDEPINVVREDPLKPGLLYAGSECAVYVSFDDGEHWQSLRLKMPATSIRDLVVKDDDLVVGTHGRSFWILDDVTPLRQYRAGLEQSEAVLFKPQRATRVHWNLNTDTPIPQEEPAGQNPPDGAVIHYYLKEKAQGLVQLDILDAEGRFVRRYRSDDRPYDIPANNVPWYWLRPQQVLSGEAGAHRFCWDLRYDPLPAILPSYPIAAVYGQTTPEPTAPWVMPGNYTVRLTVNGKTQEQPLTVRMDPRVKTTQADLQLQHDLSSRCYWNRLNIKMVDAQASDLREQIMAKLPSLQTEAATTLSGFEQRLSALFETPKGSKRPGFIRLERRFDSVFGILQEADMPPTSQAIAAEKSSNDDFMALMGTYQQLIQAELPTLNALLKKAKQQPLVLNEPLQPAWTHPPVLTHPAPGEAGFTALFGEPALPDAVFPKGIWSLNNGELTATEDQCIWTKETYRDFVLDLEFKNAPGTNSGVILHCFDRDNWIPNSVEVQIADDYAPQWATAPANWQCGAIFGRLPASKKLVKKAGEWNRYTITCIGRDIWVVLNGELVTHMNMNLWVSATKNPDGSNIPSWLSKPAASLYLDGHIGLQGKHAGAPIWFRNVRIKRM